MQSKEIILTKILDIKLISQEKKKVEEKF